MKNLIILTFIMLLTSCLSKGTQNVSGEQAPQDITISLLKVSPPSVVIAPSETTQFTAIGGNAPYTFKVSSGFGAVDNNGLYNAPSTLGNNTIQVTDAGGNTVFAVVTVGSSLQVSPTTKTVGTSQTFTFSALGGVAPYTYTIVSGGGTINASTGEYTSGNIPETVTIELKDTNKEVAYSTITVVDSLTITPSSVTVEDNTVYNFSTAGGAAPYTYQVYAGSGTIDSAGNYNSPPGAGTEIIRVTDSNSSFVEATVNVELGPTIIVSDLSLAPGQKVTLSSSEGTAPFVYTVEAGTGSINGSTGEFTAPAIADATTIRATDANGFYDEIIIQTFNLKKMALGDNFSCMVHVQNDNTTSELKCWGRKENGEIGNSNSHIGDAPSEMGDNLPTINFGSGNIPIGVYSGIYSHKCSLFSNGKAKCWGYSNSGRTGIGSQTNKGEFANSMGTYLPFIQIGDGATIDTVLDVTKRISVGSEHTCVMIDTDSVKCFGNGAEGRSGNGNQTDYCNTSGNCNNNLPELDLGPGKSIVQLAASHQHSCAIIAPENRVKCWGDNGYGQLGIESTTDQVVTPNSAAFVDLGAGRTATYIATGYFHTCALLDDSSIKCWGRNNTGQLGIGTTATIGDQGGEMGAALVVADMGTTSFPISIHSKGYHNCAIFNDGGLKCWGQNNYGQLGIGNTTQKGDGGSEMGDFLPFIDVGTGETVVSIDMSDRTTCVITSASELKCWGENGYGQLGIGSIDRIGNGPSEMGDNLIPVSLGTGKTPLQVMVANNSSCALLNDNTVKCWGADESGSLGIEMNSHGDHAGETVASLSNIDLGTGNYAKDIFAGRYHVCAILMDNSMKCFGYGNSGRLGVGNTANQGDGPNEMGDNLAFTDLGTGLYATNGDGWSSHTCAVLNSGDIKCWGDGNNGRRGSGNQTDRGDGASEMGDNLATVNLGAGRTAKVVETGDNFTCTILDNDQVKCWGNGGQGRLGIGNGSQKGHNGSTTPDTYTTVNFGTGRTAKDIKLGHQHSCVLMDNDQIKCWGEGNYGRLGRGSTTDIGDSAGELGDAMVQVDLGTGRSARAIAAGIYHTCALTDNYKIKCWGYGSYGQLGMGVATYIGDVGNEMGDNFTDVILPSTDKPLAIYAAGYHTCAVMESNDIKCWGRNNAGQLGHGHIFDVGTDALSMGSNLPVTY
ncbi:MAG: alpha-tubulin suppressor-like RCC1 family protein [Bacteriovoracaceae bacterium]|jgi:alpha-tubulin suppressor-like RCC1 family protein